MKKTAGLCADIAERLQRDLPSIEGCVLPSSVVLAKRYGVSVLTMQRACAILRDQGLLAYAPRQPMAIVGRTRLLRGRTGMPLLRWLEREIQAGHRAAGTVLPKVGHFARSRNRSNHTVRGVYKALVKKGLIHQDGKKWVIGPEPKRHQTSPPVILVLLNKLSDWHSLNAERTAAFPATFLAEAARYGVEIRPVFTGFTAAPSQALASGDYAIAHEMHKLAERMLGALIPLPRSRLPDLERWRGVLAASGKPVIWFDRADEGADGRAVGQMRYHHAEAAAVRLALERLAGLGHKSILHSHVADKPWQLHRARLIQAAAKELGLRLHICVADDSRYQRALAALPANLERYARSDTGASQRAACEFVAVAPGLEGKLKKASPTPLHKLLNSLVEDASVVSRNYDRLRALVISPIFEEFLGGTDATAWLAPNDDYAKLILSWFDIEGIAIPEGLSLLAFDNYPSNSLMPFSTVDFGFGSLGFKAFHALYGDLPSSGLAPDVPAEPFVVDRGSLGPPRHGSLISHCGSRAL